MITLILSIPNVVLFENILLHYKKLENEDSVIQIIDIVELEIIESSVRIDNSLSV